MAPSTARLLSNLSGVILDEFHPVVVDAIKQPDEAEGFVWNKIKSTTDQTRWVGNQYKVSTRLRREQGLGARAESGTLPGPSAGSKVFAAHDPSFQYGRIRISGPAMAFATRDGAVVDELADQLDDLANSIKMDMERQFFGQGRGDLTVVNTAQGNTSVLKIDTISGYKYLEEGMVVDIVTAAGTVQASGLTVSLVQSITVTFESAFNGTVNDNAIVVRKGNFKQEYVGLYMIYDDTTNAYTSTYAGISRNTYRQWKGTYATWAQPNTLQLSDILGLVRKIRTKGGVNPDICVTSPLMEEEYIKLFTSQQRFAPVLKGNIGGYEGNIAISVKSTIPMLVSDMCQFNRFYFFRKKHLLFAYNTDWAWMRLYGKRNIFERINDKDEWQATMYAYLQLIGLRPSTGGILQKS